MDLLKGSETSETGGDPVPDVPRGGPYEKEDRRLESGHRWPGSTEDVVPRHLFVLLLVPSKGDLVVVEKEGGGLQYVDHFKEFL